MPTQRMRKILPKLEKITTSEKLWVCIGKLASGSGTARDRPFIYFQFLTNAKLSNIFTLFQICLKFYFPSFTEFLNNYTAPWGFDERFKQTPVIGAARGGTQGTFPPRNWKNCCRKMMLFPKALFLATTFPKIDKNSIFLVHFYQKISKISQNFPTICIFRPNARKINAEFLKFCWE